MPRKIGPQTFQFDHWANMPVDWTKHVPLRSGILTNCKSYSTSEPPTEMRWSHRSRVHEHTSRHKIAKFLGYDAKELSVCAAIRVNLFAHLPGYFSIVPSFFVLFIHLFSDESIKFKAQKPTFNQKKCERKEEKSLMYSTTPTKQDKTKQNTLDKCVEMGTVFILIV